MGLKWASILTHPHLWTLSGKRTKCCSSRFLAYLQKTSPDLSRGGGVSNFQPMMLALVSHWALHEMMKCMGQQPTSIGAQFYPASSVSWAPSIPWMICRARGMNSCNFRTPAGHGKFDGQVVKTHLLIISWPAISGVYVHLGYNGYPLVIHWLSMGYPLVIHWLSIGYPWVFGMPRIA